MSRRGRLVVAALVSVVLHGWVISGDWIPVPERASAPPPIVARLAAPEPAPPPPIAAPEPPAPRRVAPPPPRYAPSVPAVRAKPAPEIPPAEAVAETPAVAEPPQQIAVAPESTTAIARSLPRRGRITYSILYGESRTTVGRVVQAWEVEDGTYRLSSEAETSGLVEVFRPQRLRYQSQGKITRSGLRPESFLMSRTRRGQNEAAQAKFDWSAGTLAYGLARETKNAPLPPNAQDFMSFMYQYALLPPATGRFQVPITTGSRFEVYEIEVAQEEMIETPIGTLRALSVRQVPRPGSESVHVWLATEYRYFPVRIRHYDREGNFSGEQVVSEVRISEE